jgi:Flp pilus assembly protein TadD
VEGRFKEAVEEYKKALRIDPDNKQARTNLKLIYYLYNKNEEGKD